MNEVIPHKSRLISPKSLILVKKNRVFLKQLQTARVVGKGKKIRYVHFTEKCTFLLEKYLNLWRPRRTNAVFVTRMGTRLSIRMIQDIVRDLRNGAELSSQLHPHQLRHTFATELLAKGAEWSFISEELGHSDLGTTQI